MRTVLLFESYLQTLKDKFEKDIISYLYEIDNEFPIKGSYKKMKFFDMDGLSPKDELFSVQFKFKVDQLNLFHEVFHEGIFDRIRQDFPKIEIKFLLYEIISASPDPSSIGYQVILDKGVNDADDYNNLLNKISEELEKHKKWKNNNRYYNTSREPIAYTIEMLFN